MRADFFVERGIAGTRVHMFAQMLSRGGFAVHGITVARILHHLRYPGSTDLTYLGFRVEGFFPSTVPGGPPGLRKSSTFMIATSRVLSGSYGPSMQADSVPLTLQVA